ncbi:MAG: TonB-dependent receptor plug domain-containing protein [Chlorobi bacterium]|nr:TonB-dependent receptor plug domain-containing protein [Chlorobiota bacterium]
MKKTKSSSVYYPPLSIIKAYLLVSGLLLNSFVWGGNTSNEVEFNLLQTLLEIKNDSLIVNEKEDSLQLEDPGSTAIPIAFGINRDNKGITYSIQRLDNPHGGLETNFVNLLTGKIAGLQVSRTASGTGGSPAVRIRGVNNFIGYTQPLYVVDGMPITNMEHSSGGVNSGDNDYGSSIDDINPWDIKSITVIKGLNATAFYGQRANNGVILITTKTGNNTDGFSVELNSSLSFEQVSLSPQFQNKYSTGYEGTNLYGNLKEIDGVLYETLNNWLIDSWGPPLDGRRIVVDPFVYPEDKNTRTLALLPQPANNVKNFYETGITNSNYVAITRNIRKTNARFSFGNSSNTGIVPNHKNEKQMINLRVHTQLFRKLSFDIKANYIHSEGNNRPALGIDSDNLVKVFSSMGRYVPLPWLQKYYGKTGESGKWPGIKYNPYYIINALKNNNNRDRFIGYGTISYDITNWLKLTGRYGSDSFKEKRKNTWPVGAKGTSNGKGEISNVALDVKEQNIDILMNINKKISKSFSCDISIGFNRLNQKMENEYFLSRFAESPYNGIFDTLRSNQSIYEQKTLSLYLAAQLGFKDYLFLDFLGRKEKGEDLKNNKSSFFSPSAGVSLILTDAFNINSNILNYWKLRASYTKSIIRKDLQHILLIPTAENKDIFIESWEMGSEVILLKNRLSFDITYYKSLPTNLATHISVNSNSGYSTFVKYDGKIENKGMEISLNLSPISSPKGFNWDINANYSHNYSKAVELAPDIESLVISSDVTPNRIEVRRGLPYGSIVGYAYRKNPDGQRIVNKNGSYERESKPTILGNINPDWIGGLNNTLSYKGFSLNFLIDFVQGGELSSTTKYQMTALGTAKFTEEGRRTQDTDDDGNQLPYVGVLPGVVEIKDTEGNVVGYAPNTNAVSGQDYWAQRAWNKIGEEFILDASYIMLREIMLSYNFQPSVLKKTPFRRLTINLFGRNLWYIKEQMEDLGISPESAPNTSAWAQGLEVFSLPPTRTFGASINVSF